MTKLENRIKEDAILPFQLEHSDIRGRVGRLNETLVSILSQHSYPDIVETLVAEAVLITALIGQTINLKWKLSLQIRGNGSIKLIATDYFAPDKKNGSGKIRAFASFDEKNLNHHEKKPFNELGKGYFAVLIDQGPKTDPYQGITPLTGGSLHKCAETYFAQSEQLPTRFSITVGKSNKINQKNIWKAGGIIIQKMPKSAQSNTGVIQESQNSLLSPADLLDEDENEDWNRVNFHIDTVDEFELTGPYVTQQQLLVKLFHEEKPRAFEPRSIEFGCTCSPKKVKNTMSMYSSKDIEKMTTEEGTVTADCQFCGKHFIMDPSELGFDAKNND